MRHSIESRPMPAEGHPGQRDVARFAGSAKLEIRWAMRLVVRLWRSPQCQSAGNRFVPPHGRYRFDVVFLNWRRPTRVEPAPAKSPDFDSPAQDKVPLVNGVDDYRAEF
jgi:hypothetical protein